MRTWWARWDVVVVQGVITIVMVWLTMVLRRGRLRLEKDLAWRHEALAFWLLSHATATLPDGGPKVCSGCGYMVPKAERYCRRERCKLAALLRQGRPPPAN